MATKEEIEQRIGDADSTRTTRRIAAAKQVGELARRRTTIAEQLADLEQQLGTAIADSNDVIEIDELAQFTDVPAADLAQWLNARKTPRARRKRSPTAARGTDKGSTTSAPSTAHPDGTQTASRLRPPEPT